MDRPVHPDVSGLFASRLVVAADLAGTLVFAVEGAARAIGARLDLVGIIVLAIVTALGGGMVRDTLLGSTPVAALRDARYLAMAMGGALVAMVVHATTTGLPAWVTPLDALGLALFAVAGTEKALAAGLHPLVVPALGTITAVGGGVIGDVLLSTVPRVLRVDVYATAALAGSVAMVGALGLRLQLRWAALLGGGVCAGLRLAAVHHGWQLPTLAPA